MHILFSALYRNISSSLMTMYIGFPSKVAGITIVGEYPLGFVGVGIGNGRDPLARASTSEALSASSKCTRLSQFLSDADKECLVTKSVLICVVLAYFKIATLVEEIVGVGTIGGAPPAVVVGDDGENIVGLIVVGLLIGVAFPKIEVTVWLPSWMVLSNIDCCSCCKISFMTAMSLTSNVIWLERTMTVENNCLPMRSSWSMFNGTFDSYVWNPAPRLNC